MKGIENLWLLHQVEFLPLDLIQIYLDSRVNLHFYIHLQRVMPLVDEMKARQQREGGGKECIISPKVFNLRQTKLADSCSASQNLSEKHYTELIDGCTGAKISILDT